MSEPALIPEHKLPWWRHPWPWFLMVLPMSAVIGGIVTIWLATSNADDLVSDDYYKDGLAIRQVVERDTRAEQLGLSAKLDVQAGILKVDLAGQLPTDIDHLKLQLIHPTQAGQDIALTLKTVGKHEFISPLPALTAGRYQIRLEPPDRSWRLTGEWHSPFTSRLTLQAHL